jgi:hypothetical protein
VHTQSPPLLGQFSSRQQSINSQPPSHNHLQFQGTKFTDITKPWCPIAAHHELGREP